MPASAAGPRQPAAHRRTWGLGAPNLLFLGLAALSVWRFLRTGGPDMLCMRDKPMSGHGERTAQPGP